MTIQDRADVIRGTAETVPEGDERDRSWAQMVALFKNYGEYQDKTDRRIPVVRVRPVSGPS